MLIMTEISLSVREHTTEILLSVRWTKLHKRIKGFQQPFTSQAPFKNKINYNTGMKKPFVYIISFNKQDYYIVKGIIYLTVQIIKITFHRGR